MSAGKQTILVSLKEDATLQGDAACGAARHLTLQERLQHTLSLQLCHGCFCKLACKVFWERPLSLWPLWVQMWVQWRNELAEKFIGVELYFLRKITAAWFSQSSLQNPLQTALPGGFFDRGHKRKPFSLPFYALMMYAWVKKSVRSLVSFNSNHGKCLYFGHSERVPHCKEFSMQGQNQYIFKVPQTHLKFQTRG